MEASTEARPRVWVTQETAKYNYVPAEKYGDIRFMTDQDFSPVQESLRNHDLLAGLRRQIADIDPDNDFIVVSGSPVVTAVVFMLLSKRTSVVRMLRWSNRDYEYTPTIVKT